MNWQFSNSAPIYTQLIGQIRAGIVSGALAPGERLPSVRHWSGCWRGRRLSRRRSRHSCL